MATTLAGIDIGYSSTKVVAEHLEIVFPSVVGTADLSRFSTAGTRQSEIVIGFNQNAYLVGEQAVVKSRFLNRREDRNWILSTEYMTLLAAALSHLTPKSVKVVTGLPIAFYDDKDALKQVMNGVFNFKLNGMDVAYVSQSLGVLPQPFGTLFSVALNEDGTVAEQDLLTGTVGIIDVGGKTTNILTVVRAAELARETASVNVGGWDMVRAVGEMLNVSYPELDMRDHEIAKAIVEKKVKYYGSRVSIADIVGKAVQPLAERVVAQATQLWNSGAHLDTILVTGGGSYLVYEYIYQAFRHARRVEMPVTANARGYYRYGKLMEQER